MPFWESSIFWGIDGIVAGFLISTIFYFVGKERYSMKHRITAKQIVTREITSIPEINVSFNNKPLKELTESTIKFTNSGNQIITPDDYATKEPLGIHISGRLYKYSASAENNNSMPEIEPLGKKTYKIKFDFLKPKQSFSIVMFHDGNITIFGDLRRGKGFGANITMAKRSPTLVPKLFVGAFAIISVVGYFLFPISPLISATIGIIWGTIVGNLLKYIKKAKSRRAFMKEVLEQLEQMKDSDLDL